MRLRRSILNLLVVGALLTAAAEAVAAGVEVAERVTLALPDSAAASAFALPDELSIAASLVCGMIVATGRRVRWAGAR